MWEEWPTVAVIVAFVAIEGVRIGCLVLKNVRLKRQIADLEWENLHLQIACSELRTMSVVDRPTPLIIARLPDGKHNLN